MMTARPSRAVTLALLLGTGLLAACDRPLPPEDQPPPAGTPEPEVFTLTVERHYTLEDPRAEDFSTRITAEAATVCPGGRHRVQATRPIGAERIAEDFLYRLYEVRVSCTG